MSYPNLFNYINTNTITIGDVREACQEESNILQQNILNAANNASTSMDETQEYLPLTQNITRAMGDYWFSIDGTIPPGGLPHLGHLVSREAYGDFYLWLESTKIILTDEEWLAYAESHENCCPHYSSGDGSTTFRTPKYDNAFLKTISSINGAGVYEEEGLPDPQLDILFRQDSTSSGVYKDVYGTDGKTGSAYSNTSGTDEWMQSALANENTLTPFAVRAENFIYGNSDHVTPKNISFMIGVYAVGAIVPVGTTDAEKIMSGVTRVEGLLDSKIDNTTPHIIEKYHSGTQWYRIWSDGWIEQGGRVTTTTSSGTLTFNKEFIDTNYTITTVEGEKPLAETAATDTAGYAENMGLSDFTTTSVRYSCTANRHFNWYACGY